MGNYTLTPSQLAACKADVQSDWLVKKAGLPTAHSMLFWCGITTTVQALIAGSCIQLVYHYFYQPRRDSTLARIAIAWGALLTLCHVVIANYSMSRLIEYNNRYLAVLYLDWWVYQLSYLFFILTSTPILLFFTHRAYTILDHRPTQYLCWTFILPAFILGLASASLGLYAPWGLQPLSNDEFKKWGPAFAAQYAKSHILSVCTIVAQLVAALVVSFATCWGIFRHRNGVGHLDSAISKIVFLCGESLLPVVVIALIDSVRAFMPTESNSVILSRTCVQLEPLLYFHGLMSALVSRERVATILSADPVRRMSTYPFPTFPISPGSPRSPMEYDKSPRTPDLILDTDPDTPLAIDLDLESQTQTQTQSRAAGTSRTSGGKINWTTLQMHPEKDLTNAPDCVDISKVSYHSQYALSPTDVRDAWGRRRSTLPLRFGEGPREAEGDDPGESEGWREVKRDEDGVSVYSFEEMLSRGPVWPPAGAGGISNGGGGWGWGGGGIGARSRESSVPRFGFRSSSLVNPLERAGHSA